MKFYKSPRGEDVVLSCFYKFSLQDRAKILRALKGLEDDKTNSRGALWTKLLRKPVWELKVGHIRILYMISNGEVCILHMILKKSKKIEQSDITLAVKRAEEWN